MPATWVYPKTWIAGEILTASDLNTQFATVTNNFIPGGMDDYSASTTEMRVMTDPYPGGVPSLATSLQGELERLRYQFTNITGETTWEIDPDATIAGIMAGTAKVGAATAADTATTATTATSLAMTGEASASSNTNPVSLDLGTVTAGDRVFVSAGCIYANFGAPGVNGPQIYKSDGTSTVVFNNNYTQINTGVYVASGTPSIGGMYLSVAGVCQVTGSGTLTLAALGILPSGASLTSVQIYAFFLKKQ